MSFGQTLGQTLIRHREQLAIHQEQLAIAHSREQLAQLARLARPEEHRRREQRERARRRARMKRIPRVPIHDIEVRFWQFTDIVEDECWLWHGPMRSDGYGRFTVDGVAYRAHVWSFTRFVGEVPPGHLLTRRPSCPAHCVNYQHWTPKTRSQINAEMHAERSAAYPTCVTCGHRV